MSALKRLENVWSRVTFSPKPLPEPEPVYSAERPMTGFFAGLTADQKKRALAYTGDDTHGDPSKQRVFETAT
jgi:hypothetical protein